LVGISTLVRPEDTGEKVFLHNSLEHDAFGQIALFLPPSEELWLLWTPARSDFQRLQWASQSKDDELPLQTLEMKAYHEYLLQPHTSSHNTDLSDDDL
jgi:hypothetical protein